MYIDGKEFTNKQRKDFLKSYVKLVMANLIEFLKARYKTYSATNFSKVEERPNHICIQKEY